MAAAIASVVAVDAGAAGAQTTFQACRVPGVGAIYMINVAGAPSACLDASHVAFSWTEGGALATGSVTTTHILDGTIAPADHAAGSVTTTAISNGTITAADIADGAITQVKLDPAVAFPLADGAVTSAKILDGAIVAADIAASAVTSTQIANGTIATVDVADGAITSAKLAGDLPVVVTADLGAQGLPASDGNLGSVVVNAPGAGFVVVTASGMIQATKGAGVTYSAYVGVSDTSATLVAGSLTRLYMSAAVSAGGYEIPYTVHGMFPVTAGARTFYLVGNGSGTTYFNRLTATFIGQ